MASIDGIEITGDAIANAIRTYYPNSIKIVEQQKLYNYMLIFGIRVSTCDTSIPDDHLGAIRLTSSYIGNDYWDMILTDGTTDPSPKYLKPKTDLNGNPIQWWFDSEAKLKGGTAWVKEGQYIYYYRGLYHDYPSWGPKTSIPVYRWNPSYPNEKFDASKAVLSDTMSTLIHRNWSLQAGHDKLVNDSAGCQVFGDNKKLWTMKDWSDLHIKMYKINSFTYSLFTREQFVNANRSKTTTQHGGVISAVSNIFDDIYNQIRTN